MSLHEHLGWHQADRPAITTAPEPTRVSIRRACRLVPTLTLFAVLAGLTWYAFAPGWTPQWGTNDGGFIGLAVLCGLYALLLALPFVPAIELGLLVMVLFGKMGAVIAWLATVLGLNIAFGVGRYLGRCVGSTDGVRLPPALARWLERLATTRARALVPVLTLAFLLNLPGNTAIGGGGGISMLYGATHALSWPAFALTVIVATSVLPLLFILGVVGLEPVVDTVMAAESSADGAQVAGGRN